jgi:tellurite resistance-related uncharacterized protein
VIRQIVGFHQDDVGDWVAELSCLHNQHVRHRPPFQDRPWVTTADGRADKLESDIDCPLCDRTELPAGLHPVRTAGPFDADTVPAGLRTSHRVAHATWGRLRVIDGTVGISVDTQPATIRRLGAGEEQAIPPLVPHRLEVDAPVTLVVDFLVRSDGEQGVTR